LQRKGDERDPRKSKMVGMVYCRGKGRLGIKMIKAKEESQRTRADDAKAAEVVLIVWE
jgi:hypothetical protein